MKWNTSPHSTNSLCSLYSRMSYGPAERLKSQCFVLCLFCYMWHIGSVRVWTKLWFTIGLKQQAFHIGWSFFGEWVWGRLNFFRSSSILQGQRLRPHCACWQAGHIAHIHSINVLLAPFLTSWMLGSDRCMGRQGWRNVWLFERLGLFVWQDLPSHDRWRLEHKKERGKRERKLTVLHHGGL